MPTIESVTLDTMNLLQTLNASVSTVKAPAVASYPTVLDTPNLPCIITWPGAADWWIKGGGFIEMLRTYRIICFIQPLGQDDIPSRTVDGVTLLQQIGNLYVNVANVAQANPPPYQLTIESDPSGTHHADGGLVPSISFGGKPFVGFELSVKVRALWIPT